MNHFYCLFLSCMRLIRNLHESSKLQQYLGVFAPYRFPYKQMPPLGYLVSWLIEFMATFCLGCYIVPNLCLLIGTSWLMIAFVKDISDELLKLNIRRASHRHRWELKVRFCSVVQLYADVKQLSKRQMIIRNKTCEF